MCKNCRFIIWIELIALSALWCIGIAISWAQNVPTGQTADLSVDGPGWFLLKDVYSGKSFVTRKGRFAIDSSGYVVSPPGLRVQGYCDSQLNLLGDLLVDSAGSDSTASIMNFSFNPNGDVVVVQADGYTFIRGRVLLQNIDNPDKLSRISYGIYAATPEAGVSTPPASPGSNGLGQILNHSLDSTPEAVRLTLKPSADQTGVLTEGFLTPTRIATDLGIRGAGFFLVRDAKTSELFATRAGAFVRDREGYLTTYSGLRVQGYSDSGLSIEGDVQIDETGGGSASPLVMYQIESSGAVTVLLQDGTCFTRSLIRLFNFRNPNALSAQKQGLYSGVVQGGPESVEAWGIVPFSLELINISPDLIPLRQMRSFFIQGVIVSDDCSTHLAISGNGFFVVRDPQTGESFVTRVGLFHLDEAGYLVTTTGLRVQGYDTPELVAVGDIQIDASGSLTSASMWRFSIDDSGIITVTTTDGGTFARARIVLQSFLDSTLLVPCGNGLYSNIHEAGPLSSPVAPSSAGVGALEPESLELITSPEPLDIPSRNGVRLQVTGEPGNRWIIQVGTNLSDWTNLQEQAPAEDEIEFTDTDSNTHPFRFYRVQVEK